MTDKKYSEVKTCDELEKYIIDSTVKHTKLSQYTSINSYDKIIETNSLRLTRIDKLNDITEVDLANENKNLFIACFTYSHSEFASMWYMYGRNELGNKGKMLLEFKNAKFNENFDYYYIDNYENKKYFKAKRVEFKDIVYVDESKKQKKLSFLKYHTSGLTKIAYEECDHYCKKNSGMIKYKTWETEKEVRLLVESKDIPSDFSYIFLNFDDVGITAKDIVCVANPWNESLVDENMKRSKIHKQIADRDIDIKCEKCKFGI